MMDHPFGSACRTRGVQDEEREAWKNIYDHWDLGKAKLGLGHKYCREYPCNYHCTSKVVTCMETMNGNKAPLIKYAIVIIPADIKNIKAILDNLSSVIFILLSCIKQSY